MIYFELKYYSILKINGQTKVLDAFLLYSLIGYRDSNYAGDLKDQKSIKNTTFI